MFTRQTRSLLTLPSRQTRSPGTLFLARGGVAAGRQSDGGGERSHLSLINLGTYRFLMVFFIKEEQKSRGLFA